MRIALTREYINGFVEGCSGNEVAQIVQLLNENKPAAEIVLQILKQRAAPENDLASPENPSGTPNTDCIFAKYKLTISGKDKVITFPEEPPKAAPTAAVNPQNATTPLKDRNRGSKHTNADYPWHVIHHSYGNGGIGGGGCDGGGVGM